VATLTTRTSEYPWPPDISVFHASDAVSTALIMVASTISGAIEGDEPSLRVAFVEDDNAQFTAEATEIPEAAPELAEVVVHTGKITQLVRLSNEQWRQEGTDAQLSESVRRAVVKKADEAFLAQPAPTPPAVQPAPGLLHVSGLVDGGEVADNLDELVNLQAELQLNGLTPTHLILDPCGRAALRQMKFDDTGSNQSLIGAGTTDAAPMLLSLPVIVNREMPSYRGLLIDRTEVVSAVGQVYVAVSEHRYFEYDSQMLRIRWRIGQNVVRPDRCGKFTVAAPGS
jgi:HK97 family phage major capsid protein